MVVIDHISEMVATAVVRLSDAHRVVREIHIAVVACGALLARANPSVSHRPTEEWNLLAGAQEEQEANLYFGMVSFGVRVASRLGRTDGDAVSGTEGEERYGRDGN